MIYWCHQECHGEVSQMIRMNYGVMTRFSNDYIINGRRRAGEETEETQKMTIKRGKERQQNKKSLPAKETFDN